MREKYLLGVNNNNELVFGEFEVTHRNGYAQFSASFSTVRPFNGDDYDLTEYYESYIWGEDKATLYDLCENFDCRPSELAEYLADDCYDIRDALDCSLYPECYEVDGNNYYFESCSCGQHDTREDGMKVYVNKEAYDILHDLWDNYHLKEVDDTIISKVEKLKEILSETPEEAWIVDYIENNIEDFE
jgi:hypothetical protein